MVSLRRGPDERARALFFRSLGTMFSSGVALVAALEMLAEQQEDPALGEACRGLAKKVSEGHYLSKAMQGYPNVFTSMHQKMIFSGERSGQLNQVLIRLAEREEKQRELFLRVRNSLTMPLLVSGFCLMLALVVPPVLFKGLFEMLNDLKVDIPWSTGLLIKLSRLFSHPACLLLPIPLLVTARWLLRHLYSDANWQRRLFALPMLGPTLRLLAVANFTQNLRTLIDVGMPILPALELSAAGTDMVYLEEVIAGVQQSIKEGESLAYAFEKSEFFPAAFVQGMRASEEAGKMTAMLESLEMLIRVDLEQRLELLAKSLEPLVMLVIGGLVAFTLVATLKPMLAVLDKL